MKDAMGELNMTVVTIVAIGAIAAFFTAFLWPSIKNNIMGGWNNINNSTINNNYPSTIVLPEIFDVPNISE